MLKMMLHLRLSCPIMRSYAELRRRYDDFDYLINSILKNLLSGTFVGENAVD